MNRFPVSLVVVVTLAMGSAVQAELRISGADQCAGSVRPIHPDVFSRPALPHDGELLSASHDTLADPLTAGALGQYASLPLTEPAEQTVYQELPALPGSASLFLSAALSVGAWHVVRKSRDIHLGHLPEWYHADAPLQVGHSVAVDDMGFAPLAICVFDAPAVERPVFSYTRREFHSRCEFQHFLSVEAPRGPPLRS